MRISSSRPGYIFLISVLAVGAIASVTAISLLLLGGAAERSGFTFLQSNQAFEYAQSCAERTLRSLRSDLTYIGKESFTFGQGSCKVLQIDGSGNTDRIICIEGTSGTTVRRLQIKVAKVYPQTTINFWNEVSDFTLCK